MRKTLTFALLALLAITAHAQHFDWVKTIDGYDATQSNVGNKVVGSMTDRDGNLYICSSYGWGASLCGVTLPDAADTRNMVVAKISPEGELVWHKEVYGHRTGIGVNSMVPLGDTAMMVCFKLYRPGYNEWIDLFGTRYGSQYHDFDSLFVGPDSLQFYSLYPLCFATFNLDGEITEMHYLARTFLDRDGNPFTGVQEMHPEDSLKIQTDIYFVPNAITVDREGNIIISRAASADFIWAWERCGTCVNPDTATQLSTWNGEISGMRYYVDGRRIHDFIVPFQAEDWNAQLIKFTPNLDSVLFCRYLAYDTVGHGISSAVPMVFDMWETQSLACDEDGNIFLCGTVESPLAGEQLDIYSEWDSASQSYHTITAYDTAYYRDILLDSLRPDLRIHTAHGQMYTGYVLKYNSDGELQWVHQPQFEVTVEQPMWMPPTPKGCYYRSLQATGVDGSIYILANFSTGIAYDTTCYSTVNFGLGDTAQHSYRGAGFVRLRFSDAAWLGSGCAPAPYGSQTEGTLAVQENHVAMQVKYPGMLIGNDTVYRNPSGNLDVATLAMVHFDNEGRLLSIADFGNSDAKSRIGQCLLRDSILYMTGAIASNAYLGDVTLYAGDNKGFIVKYVDTSFMTPYVPTTDPINTGDVSITLVEDGAALVAYPNPFRQSVRIKVQGGQLKEHNDTVTAILTDLSGRREEVRLTPDGPGQYTLDLTSRPQATYLLTLTTSDGRQHTVRLLKQLDIFDE